MTPLKKLEVSPYFWTQVDGIADFLEAQEASQAYEDLLILLEGQVFPNLKRFPMMGRPFMAVGGPNSVEGLQGLESLPAEWLTRLRQVIVSSYWALYATHDDKVQVLAIRHHRQLSFDFLRHWS